MNTTSTFDRETNLDQREAVHAQYDAGSIDLEYIAQDIRLAELAWQDEESKVAPLQVVWDVVSNGPTRSGS